jgi:glycosyltransferase involved in cell wall biosynthesis
MQEVARGRAAGTTMTENILMVSADRWVVAGEKGPFHYMLESFSRHWDRVDVIGMRPEKVVQTQVFGNVHLHHPTTGKLRQARFIAETGRRLAAERDYAVMTSHDYNPFYNGAGAWRIARATGIPWVSEIHHVPGFPTPATFRERIDRWATQRYLRWARSKASGFRVVNAVELPALLTRWGVPAEAVHVLPSLYLDREAFVPRAETPLATDLLMVGRLVPNKGIPSVLQALGSLASRGMDGLTMRILGRGPERGRIDAAIAKLGLTGRIEIIDWVEDAEDLAEIYRSARVLVVASTSEGGPRVAVEAMSCGTPVIGTRVGILPELLTEERGGRLYDGSVAELALKLQRLFTDASQEQAMRAALPGDLSRFDREAVIAGLAAGLKSVASSSPRRPPSSS